MATKPKSKAPENNTLAFFRAWLSGIEEMQDEDWTPTPAQWKRIRDKIMAIEDAPAAPAVPEYQPPRQYAPAPTQFMPAPQAAPAPFMPPMPGGSGFGQPAVKTPDIDSSGGYQSSLA